MKKYGGSNDSSNSVSYKNLTFQFLSNNVS